VQGVLGMLRPQSDARGRGCWNALHHNWGRITIIAGMGNAILGALLIHGYKDEPYLNWLLPACILVGLVGIAAIVLEAFKVQVCDVCELCVNSWNASGKRNAKVLMPACTCMGGSLFLYKKGHRYVQASWPLTRGTK
jgi:hypothetical protein